MLSRSRSSVGSITSTTPRLPESSSTKTFSTNRGQPVQAYLGQSPDGGGSPPASPEDLSVRLTDGVPPVTGNAGMPIVWFREADEVLALHSGPASSYGLRRDKLDQVLASAGISGFADSLFTRR